MPPQIDHYIGRPVASVGPVDGKDAWDWGIRFVGDVLVRNHDKRRTKVPEKIVGLVYLAIAMSELDTRLMFGHYEIVEGEQQATVDEQVMFTPTEYSISDPTFEDEPYFPQRPDKEEDFARMVPADPSAERVQDAPFPMPDVSGVPNVIVTDLSESSESAGEVEDEEE
jgi:hypothetical protein